MAGLDPHGGRGACCCGCGARGAACRCSSATARCRAACSRARCSPASSPASTSGCSTPPPRGSRCSSTPRPSWWRCCCRASCRPSGCAACSGSGWRIAFAGVVLAFSESFGHSSSGQLHGDALALAAGVLWGLTTLAIRTTRLATASAEKTLFYQIAVTAAVSPLLSLLLGERWGFVLLGLRLVLDRPADRDRRLRELPGLDVDAAALPGHAHLVLHLSHAAVRAGVRRGAARRSR